MKKSISQSSTSKRNQLLREVLRADKSLLGEVIDADICNDVAMSLHSLRIKANITQADLAERLGVKQSNISRWEHAGYQGYKVKMLSKIVRTLGGRIEININPIKNTQVIYLEHTQFNNVKMSHSSGWTMSADSIVQQKAIMVSAGGTPNETI